MQTHYQQNNQKFIHFTLLIRMWFRTRFITDACFVVVVRKNVKQ